MEFGVRTQERMLKEQDLVTSLPPKEEEASYTNVCFVEQMVQVCSPKSPGQQSHPCTILILPFGSAFLTHMLQVPQSGDHRGCGTGQLEGRLRRLAQLSVEHTQQSAVTSHSGEQHRLPSYYSSRTLTPVSVQPPRCVQGSRYGGLESCVLLYFMAKGFFFFIPSPLSSGKNLAFPLLSGPKTPQEGACHGSQFSTSQE